MASYTPVPGSVSSSQRTALISNVASGDQVDVKAVLGRSARGVKFQMTATTDVIDFKLNSLVRMRQHVETGADVDVEVWSSAAHHSVYRGVGKLEHTTETGINVDSFEIEALTLSSGTTIDVAVW
tara:strand:+ start:511 stop:885 length:375 start_codon:yes stop_codon:yes gene_type:complete